MNTIKFEKLQSFLNYNPDVDSLSLYFLGICSNYFPDTLPFQAIWKELPFDRCRLKEVFSKDRSDNGFLSQTLVHLIHYVKFDKPSTRLPELSSTKVEENSKFWFNDFSLLLTLYPKITKAQWFFAGSFVAGQNSRSVYSLLKGLYVELIIKQDSMTEKDKIEYLMTLLEGKAKEVSSNVSENPTVKQTNTSNFGYYENQKPVSQLEKELKSNFGVEKYEERAGSRTSKAKELLQISIDIQRDTARKPLQTLKENRAINPSTIEMRSFSNSKVEKSAEISYPIKKNFDVPPPTFQRSSLDCAICLESMIRRQFTILSSCRHAFHSDCFQQYLCSKIDELGFPIVCPMEKCGVSITESKILVELSEEYKKKYHSFHLKHFKMQFAKDIINCPTPDCEFFSFKVEGAKSFYCGTCFKAFCVECWAEWHDGTSCKENEEQRKEEEENDTKFREYVTENSCQSCPSCLFYVHKVDGCKHITCRCSFEFCYVCGNEMNGCICPE